MRAINIFFVLSLLVNPTFQDSDRSFKERCLAKNGDYQPQSGQSYLPNQCVITIPLNAETLEDAQYHCDRWGLWALDKAEMTNEKYAKCTFSEIYTCRPEFVQIKGMCYRWHNSLMSYNDAEETCGRDNSEVLRMYDELGELFDDIVSQKLEQLADTFGHICAKYGLQRTIFSRDNIDDLSIYHVQPDQNLNSSPRFFGGSGPNYIVLFAHAVHYRAGFNTIHRFSADQKAYTVCQYRPKETFYSFKLAITKLGSLYYMSQVSGDHLIWRTTNVYTRKYFKYFNHESQEKERICEDSMSAILGTKEGTFADPNKKLTNSLTREMKESFVVAYAPIEVCPYHYAYFHYFRAKETIGLCETLTRLDYDQYNGDFKRDYERVHAETLWHYVYMPQVTSGYNIITTFFPHMAPALCTIGRNG